MLRRINAVLLVFLYFVTVIQPLYPVIIYHADYHYIVTTLCVNRNKPWLHCDGKCFLRKEFKDIYYNKHHHPQHQNILSFNFQQCIPIHDPFLWLKPDPSLSVKRYNFYSENYHFRFYQKFLHPPQFA